MLERVINMNSLYRSWQRLSVKNAGGGLDGVDISFYRADLRKNLRALQTAVSSGNYRPYAEKIYANHKNRKICISCVDDKIIQTVLADAIMMAYVPAKSVHGFINKRSVFTAKKTLDEALEDGAKFIHSVLSHCDDYDYAETQRRINKYGVNNPLGCKKLCERVGGNDKCDCNFSAEKLYPTPIIHALRVDRKCFTPTEPKDNIGHFKAKNPKNKAMDALSAILELNKKQYEITEQQKILKGQIEDLFERTNTLELVTPQGLMFKTEEGIFIKVG
jgi:hypothetical protein